MKMTNATLCVLMFLLDFLKHFSLQQLFWAITHLPPPRYLMCFVFDYIPHSRGS